LGTVNVHASLLPKYRGAAPIQWAIAHGETVTGVTTMRIETGLDTGDILLQEEVEIGPEETASQLSARLAEKGANLLLSTLRGLEAGSILPRKQDPAAATYAPILKKQDGLVDWGRPAQAIANQVRGFDPWPGAFTSFRGEGLHVRRARAVAGPPGEPGRLEVEGRVLRVICGEGRLELLEVQPEGKRRMTAQEFLSGRRPATGEKLG
jgi:methionyl-tRNA formyltransferase